MSESDLDETMVASDGERSGTREKVPEQIAGRYRVVRVLGGGAQKTVYLVHDDQLDRQLALGLVSTSTPSGSKKRIDSIVW